MYISAKRKIKKDGNINNVPFNLVKLIISCCIITQLLGCSSPQVRVKPQQPLSFKWEDPKYNAVSVDFKVNVNVDVVDDKTFILSGNVCESSTLFNVGQSCRYWNGRYWAPHHAKQLPDVRKPLRPHYINFAHWTDIPVSPEGYFTIELTLPRSDYFKVGNTKYMTVTRDSDRFSSFWLASRSSVDETKRSGVPYLWSKSGYMRINSNLINFPPVYTVKSDIEKAKVFARSLPRLQKSLITLDVKDQISRVPVSPKITVTPVNALEKCTYIDSLSKRLYVEFGNVPELVSAGMDEINRVIKRDYANVLWKGECRSDIAQCISFDAIVDCKYKIETVHGKYNYFRGFVHPLSTKEINKLILLVEKGQKIRVEGVKEGDGGAMIDTD